MSLLLLLLFCSPSLIPHLISQKPYRQSHFQGLLKRTRVITPVIHCAVHLRMCSVDHYSTVLLRVHCSSTMTTTAAWVTFHLYFCKVEQLVVNKLLCFSRRDETTEKLRYHQIHPSPSASSSHGRRITISVGSRKFI